MTGKIVALTARSGAGKDYLASHLIKHHGYVRVSFSDELKAIANKIYPWVDLDYLPEDKNKPINHPLNVNGLSARDVWRSIDKLRDVDEEIFVHGARAKIKRLIHQGANVVITDIRKPVEYKLARQIDASIVRIIHGADPTTLIDEDIIAKFAVDREFINCKGRGFQAWEEFCVGNGFIESAWINIMPELVGNQIKENAQFGLAIQKQHTPEMWRAAIMAEYGEFLEEIPHVWKWWKPAPVFGDIQKQKATEEFVDVIKFAIGHWLQFGVEQPVEVSEDISCEFEVPGISVGGINRLTNLIGMLAYEIANEESYMKTVMCAIQVGCDIIGISKKVFADSYIAKYELNAERLRSGYCETGNKEGLEHAPIHDVQMIPASELTHGQEIDECIRHDPIPWMLMC